MDETGGQRCDETLQRHGHHHVREQFRHDFHSGVCHCDGDSQPGGVLHRQRDLGRGRQTGRGQDLTKIRLCGRAGPGHGAGNRQYADPLLLDSSAVLIVSGVLSGLAAGMVQPELNSLAVLVAREDRRGLANSTFFMSMDLGCAAGAVVLGVMADRMGLSSIFLAGAVLTFVTLLLYLYMEGKGWLRVPGAEAKV